jgi:hypothetical protein
VSFAFGKMSTPSFRISINGQHHATIGLPGHGVCSCIVDWTDRRDVPERKDARVRMSLGGLDHATREFLDWPSPDLALGDTISIEIISFRDATPPPARRPVETLQDTENKKAFVRQAAKEFGWTLIERSENLAEQNRCTE